MSTGKTEISNTVALKGPNESTGFLMFLFM